MLANKYKACNLVEKIHIAIPKRVQNNTDSINSRTEWIYDAGKLRNLLQSRNCNTAVDRSFFLKNLEVIFSY